MKKIFVLVFEVIYATVQTIHEAGHAVAALLLYKEKVTMYLGSDDTNGGKRIQIGRLIIYANKKSSLGYTASCSLDDEVPFSAIRLALFHLGGPLASLTVLLLLAALLLLEILPAFLDFPCLILMILLFSDFVVSFSWREKDVYYMSNGRIAYDIIRRKSHHRHMHELRVFEIRKEYRNAITYFHSIEQKNPEHYYSVFAMVEKGKLFHEGERIIREWKKAVTPGADEYGVWANFYLVHGEQQKCLDCCDAIIGLDPENGTSYNAKAHFLFALERYEEAIACYDTGCSMVKEAELAYALSWRGSCKLKLKRYEEGRKDLDESHSMEPDNSYLHLNYGIYYLETGDEAQAKHSFQKACELDKETEGLEKYWKNGRLIV